MKNVMMTAYFAATVALVQNDKVMLIIEERLGHRKHACPPVQAVFDIRKWCKTIEDVSRAAIPIFAESKFVALLSLKILIVFIRPMFSSL